MKKPVIMDVDTGIDDGVAIGLALFSPNIDLKLITGGGGNVGAKNVSRNTINLLSFWKKNVPFAIGTTTPLKRAKVDLPNVHGLTGFGTYKFGKPLFRAQLNGVKKIRDVIMSSVQKVTIICTAPLTNIAKLLLDYPDVKDNIEQIVFMSVSIEETGQGIPYKEFNGAYDPEACEVVLNSGLNILVCPMEMGHTAYLNYKDIYITKYTNRTGKMLEETFRSYKDRHIKNGAATHDGCAVACVINPKIFEIKKVKAFVKYFKEIKTGVLMFDFNSIDTNVNVCTSVNVRKFKKLYFKLLKKMK